MLIKEYRIPLPLSVEEYRIAQLYMIQKKSRLDSTGEGSGVEIIHNHPYENGPGGSGQYTKKIYHIGNHIPGWLKSIVPKTALQVIEEAWNAYPYTKMRTTCPFVEKFFVDVETKYLADDGSTENVFGLSPTELSNQTIDLIDPVKDPVPTSQYTKEEDPLLYVSKKTGRGPLTSDWLQKPQGSIMCAYKRISVEFKYWGMQGKIEQFIHDGLRKPMLMGHRQAWVWQDEWYGLTINDIRELERETQRTLAQKMGNIHDTATDEEERDLDTLAPLKNSKKAASAIELLSQESVETDDHATLERKQTPTFVFGEWRLGSLSKSDSEDEFFDANDEFDSDLSEEDDSEHLLQVAKRYDENSHSGESVDSLDSLEKDEEYDRRRKSVGKTLSSGSSSHSVNKLRVLVLVVHGGNPLDQSGDVKSKNNDCERLVREFENVLQNHYKEGIGRVVFRLVECPQVFKEALSALKDVETETPDCEEDTPCAPFQSTGFPLSSLPILAACSGDFREMVDLTIVRANEVYKEFLNSEAGQNFNGEVCIVGDCIGGLLAYEAMSRQQRQNSFDTDLSGCSVPPSPVVKHGLGQVKTDLFQDFTPYTGGGQNNNDGTMCGRSSTSNNPGGSGTNSRHGSSTDIGKNTYYDSVGEAEEHNKDRANMVIEGLERLSLHDGEQSIFESAKKFEFYITKFFAFGSPIGLVLLYKKFSQYEAHQGAPVKPYCAQFYNLFHPCDPLSSRIEPLILKEFSQICPMSVPRYQKFPLGDGVCNDVTSWLRKLTRSPPSKMKVERQRSDMSTTSAVSWDGYSMTDDWRLGVRNWWGTERLDYALYNPKNLHHLPQSVLCPLFHISYWESKDVVAFMIRELLDLSSTGEVDAASQYRRERRQSSFYIPNPREKWRKKSTLYKIRNLTPNHRANDAIALEGAEQTITARFTYGPLDVATLSREKVDIYIMHYPPAGEWTLVDSCITGSNGRVSFTIPDEQKLEVGIYPVKMIARGDHTTVDSSLAVLPPRTEAVVFSIDGAFSASVSLRGRHPKVRPGAVDVVRHWQEKGYVIIYVTSRPAFQKHQVMSWMAEHNFPFGLVSFCGSLSTVDIQRHKSAYLRHLTNEVKVVIHAGYGSLKDVAVFAGVGVSQNAIFVIGKHSSKKHEKQATYLRDGYSSHLSSLANNPICKPASGNARLTLRKDCFGLPVKQKHSGKRHGKFMK